MKTITDEDLILLYYGEHVDPELGRRVAEDPQLRERLQRLSRELECLEALPVPDPGEDFGARTWQQIVPRLAASQTAPPAARGWFAGLAQPRFSFAGVLALVLVAGMAFWMGREIAEPLPQATTAMIDPERLLMSGIGKHLAEADVLLTTYSNDPGRSEADWAAGMVVSNRIYRQAAQAAGHQRLARLLTEMEPLLIELANESDYAQPDDSLLFRIRITNQEISNDQAI